MHIANSRYLIVCNKSGCKTAAFTNVNGTVFTATFFAQGKLNGPSNRQS